MSGIVCRVRVLTLPVPGLAALQLRLRLIIKTLLLGSYMHNLGQNSPNSRKIQYWPADG